MPDSTPAPEDLKPPEENAVEHSIDEPAATAAALMAAATANPQGVATRIEDMAAADGAAVMQTLPTDLSAEVAEYLDPETASQILAEMDAALAASVIADMEAPEASMVLAAMDPDDRVDILEHVPQPLHDELVGEMDAEERAEVRDLEQYEPDTAGGIMTTQVTALAENLTVQEAIEELRRLNEELEQMFYVYVIDNRRHLVGVLSMRDLILARPERKLSQIMHHEVTSVPATMDQEEVARLIRKYNYLAVPVVDTKHRLVGLITVDDVVDVIQDEATEDVQKMFGAGAEERLTSSWSFSFRKRIWWLEFNLVTAFMAAWVVSRFDEVISKLAILAALQSVVSGMGGNAGAQTLAVAIRGMALGENAPRILGRVLRKELMVGLLTGLVVGITTWACCDLHIFGADKYQGKATLVGFVVFLALLLNHINAGVTGVLIPFLMRRLGFDPAQSATIFATTFTDCGGFFLTLWLAQRLIHL
jgi:magnesium transporter